MMMMGDRHHQGSSGRKYFVVTIVICFVIIFFTIMIVDVSPYLKDVKGQTQQHYDTVGTTTTAGNPTSTDTTHRDC